MSGSAATPREAGCDVRENPRGLEPAALRGNVALYRFACLVVVATFGLIIAGGIVTSADAGLAVPDWPLSFGSINPAGWTTMYQVNKEHAHRLIGASIGLLTLTLTMWILISERRNWVRKLGVLALLFVVVQGIMGGLRVTELMLSLAIVHGCFGQLFFCLLVAIATVLSPRWPTQRIPVGADGLRRLRTWSTVLFLMVMVQLILGAILRHTHEGVMLHLAGAMGVGICLMLAAQQVMAYPSAYRLPTRPMIVVMMLFAGQLLLGFATFLVVRAMASTVPANGLELWLPTVHVATGAAVFGLTAHIMVRVFALTSPGHVSVMDLADECTSDSPASADTALGVRAASV